MEVLWIAGCVFYTARPASFVKQLLAEELCWMAAVHCARLAVGLVDQKHMPSPQGLSRAGHSLVC
jgi:hypothetical protein